MPCPVIQLARLDIYLQAYTRIIFLPNQHAMKAEQMCEITKPSTEEVKLMEEVEFWRKMLNDIEHENDSPVFQRTLNALQLAEYRLNSLRRADK